MSWGEDERTDYQAEWYKTKKCYYCSELKDDKLTKLDGRVVCFSCLHTVAEHRCPFCGEWFQHMRMAKVNVNGKKICYKCYSLIPR